MPSRTQRAESSHCLPGSLSGPRGAGTCCYAAGEYAEALAEMRAHRRMTGLAHQIQSWLTASAPRQTAKALAAGMLMMRRCRAPRRRHGQKAVPVRRAPTDMGQGPRSSYRLDGSELEQNGHQAVDCPASGTATRSLEGVGRHEEARSGFADVAAVDDGGNRRTTNAWKRGNYDGDTSAAYD